MNSSELTITRPIDKTRLVPEETLELYKRYDITPVTGYMLKLDETETRTLCCGAGVNCVHAFYRAQQPRKINPPETMYMDQDQLGISGSYWDGYIRAFDSRMNVTVDQDWNDYSHELDFMSDAHLMERKDGFYQGHEDARKTQQLLLDDPDIDTSLVENLWWSR